MEHIITFGHIFACLSVRGWEFTMAWILWCRSFVCVQTTFTVGEL